MKFIKTKFDLLEGNIRHSLMLLAIPIIGTMFLQMSYSLIDLIWVGRLGSDAVAAVGTAGLIINLGYAIGSLFITGTSIKISHSIGRKDNKEAKEYMEIGVMLMFLFSILFTVILIFGRTQIIGIFNIENEYVNKQAALYLAVFSFSLLFNFGSMIIGGIFNSIGNSKLPFKINILGVIINIILDPLLIFYFNWGIIGAAIGTIIANVIIFVMLFRYLVKIYSIKLSINLNRKKVLDILTLGSPMAIQRIIFTVIGIAIAIIVAKWGPSAIAAQKIGLQIEAITYMSIGGLNRSLGIFVGQNFGANKLDRINLGYWTGVQIAVTIGLITTAIFLLLPYQLMRIFISNPETIKAGVLYLRIVGLSQIFMCIEMVSNGAFTGMGKPHIPSVISIIFTSLRVPLALLLSTSFLFGIEGVWMSISISSFVKGIISMTIFIHIMHSYGNKRSKGLQEARLCKVK
jgi:putative MATE family efflux protein